MAKQTNQYDKIFRENLEAFIPTFISKILKIKAIDLHELPDDLQHTKERKPDFLKQITDDKNNVFILHIEFQLADDQEMIFRMNEYCSMLLRKYKISVKQYVVYLGEKQSKMASELKYPNLWFKYELLSFAKINSSIFLNSTKPEEILLALLGNYGKINQADMLKSIINKLDTNSKGELEYKNIFHN